MPMFGASVSASSSTSVSSAAGQGDFNLTGGGGQGTWIPWVVLGAVAIIGLIVFLKRSK